MIQPKFNTGDEVNYTITRVVNGVQMSGIVPCKITSVMLCSTAVKNKSESLYTYNIVYYPYGRIKSFKCSESELTLINPSKVAKPLCKIGDEKSFVLTQRIDEVEMTGEFDGVITGITLDYVDGEWTKTNIPEYHYRVSRSLDDNTISHTVIESHKEIKK